MDRMIYVSMAGAKALMQRQDALTHNLANAGTDGFRADTIDSLVCLVSLDGNWYVESWRQCSSLE